MTIHSMMSHEIIFVGICGGKYVHIHIGDDMGTMGVPDDHINYIGRICVGGDINFPGHCMAMDFALYDHRSPLDSDTIANIMRIVKEMQK